MAQAITIDEKTIQAILKRLDKLTQDVQTIKERILEKEPVYGSAAWWEKEIAESEQEFQKGKGILFDTAEDAKKWLKS